MDEKDLIQELAQRAGVSAAEARAVLGALAAHRQGEGARAARPAAAPVLAPYEPSGSEVERLIEAAGAHALGLDFLLTGELAAVAAVFGAHAFTVEAARRRLAGRGR